MHPNMKNFIRETFILALLVLFLYGYKTNATDIIILAIKKLAPPIIKKILTLYLGIEGI